MPAWYQISDEFLPTLRGTLDVLFKSPAGCVGYAHLYNMEYTKDKSTLQYVHYVKCTFFVAKPIHTNGTCMSYKEHIGCQLSQGASNCRFA